MDTQTIQIFMDVAGKWIDLQMAVGIAFITALILQFVKIANNKIKMIIPVILGGILAFITKTSLIVGLCSGVVAIGGTAYVIELIKKSTGNSNPK